MSTFKVFNNEFKKALGMTTKEALNFLKSMNVEPNEYLEETSVCFGYIIIGKEFENVTMEIENGIVVEVYEDIGE